MASLKWIAAHCGTITILGVAAPVPSSAAAQQTESRPHAAPNGVPAATQSTMASRRAPGAPVSEGHQLLDFRYRPYDIGGPGAASAHPAYEVSGAVAGGGYTSGHVGGRRIVH